MIILSKANLVNEGIDLDEIKNLIREDSFVVGADNEDEFSVLENLQKMNDKIKNSTALNSFVVGEDNGGGFSELLEDLQLIYDEIQKVLFILSTI